jgi:hypothetical protein
LHDQIAIDIAARPTLPAPMALTMIELQDGRAVIGLTEKS